MEDTYLYKKMESLDQAGFLLDIPQIITDGLGDNIVLRDYQINALQYFITYYENEKLHKNKKIHTLFHMATGSGKTVIMAGLILYLYTKGYRKFLFFVNQSNVIEKTKDNFTNPESSKYLFSKKIEYLGNTIKIVKVDNFSYEDSDDIEICFTTTQKLHMNLNWSRENSITYEDFENNKIVFISDESHHINSLTKKETKIEEEERKSWEYSVTNAFHQNKDSILLEFTATADLKDKNVLEKYRDKIIYDYTLKKFRESGYTKIFQNFATSSDLWKRTLMALILSEYRKFLFNDEKINIKPVVLLKSQKIEESKEFYKEFFYRISKISKQELLELFDSDMQPLIKALNYFKNKDNSFKLLIHSLQNSFTMENSIIMNGTTDNNTEKQLLVNSLEDKSNPIRVIFTVDMLNEGWDVLNLFDIVRLYDTRQGSGKPGKIGAYTIKEAQLIGRGARYCPFQIIDDQEKYKRKYDNDLNNDYRILETMYFHSLDDSKYITELTTALVATGLQDNNPIQLNYTLKQSFKDSEFYQKALIFSNKRILKGRNNITDIEDTLKTKIYRYSAKNNKGKVVDLMDTDFITSPNTDISIKTFKFKDIDYNILEGATERYKELNFNVIKSKYPHVKSLREFLTSDKFLGNNTIEITFGEELTGKTIRNACIKAFGQISKHITSIKDEYEGSREFKPMYLKDVIKDKSIYISKIEGNGGKGDSQNNCSNEDYRLNLANENWYVFNDNYGTNEEKLFLKYFKTDIEPILKAKNLEYYIIRNERIPDLAIYSFQNGERFEPDFLLLIRDKKINKFKNTQVYIEPKGNNLLDLDKWKEDFLLSIKDKSAVDKKCFYGNDYEIVGLPFFNAEYGKEEFENHLSVFLKNL